MKPALSILRRSCVRELIRLALAQFLFVCASMVQASPLAETGDSKLLALVIGNSGYTDAPLAGPENDAADVADAVSKIGFTVINGANLTNLNREAMYSSLERFMERVDDHTIAVLYYSGHGVEDSGRNYLVPIGATVKNFGDIPNQLISLDQIISRLERREARTTIIILDACRTMPLAWRFKSGAPTDGLASIKDAPPGMRIIYAARPNSAAMSALPGQRNSVFTAALLQAISERLPTFDEIVTHAATYTLKATGNRQRPYSTGDVAPWLGDMPQLMANPLSQTAAIGLQRAGTQAATTDSTCKKVSEQVIENGVSTWRIACL